MKKFIIPSLLALMVPLLIATTVLEEKPFINCICIPAGTFSMDSLTNPGFNFFGFRLFFQINSNESNLIEKVNNTLVQEVTKDRFIDNLNGTVTDNQTGLIWQKVDDGTKRIYDEAVEYCKELRLGGFSDWRLPKPDEVTMAVKKEFYQEPREDASEVFGYEYIRMARGFGYEIQGADRYWTVDPDNIAFFNVTPKIEIQTIIKASKDTPLFVRAVRNTAIREVPTDVAKDISDEEMITYIRANSKMAIYFINEIQPNANSYKGKVTIIASSTEPGGSVLAKYENARYTKMGQPIFPMGDGSIHIFKARFEINIDTTDKYRFEGTEDDPLVFALIKGLGYVYLRGTGTVFLPNGTKRRFPK